MDLTFVLSAVIFTLLAVVVATSLLKGSSPAADFANARSYFESRSAAGGLEKSKQNGHVGEKKKEKKKEAENWSEISGSSHDHWDVVKSVLSEQEYPQSYTEEVAEYSTSTSSLSGPSSGSRDMSLETEGATESPAANTEKVESALNNSLKYVPGKARSHHLEMMMSKDELEDEQRRDSVTQINCLLT